MKLRRIKASSSELSSFLEANYEDMKQYEGQVQEIAQRVREKGNQAIFEYNQKFDGALINEDNFMVNEAEFEAAYDLVDDEFIFALRAAIDNIEVFHARQLRNSWMEADERGCILGQVFRPDPLHAGTWLPAWQRRKLSFPDYPSIPFWPGPAPGPI